VGRAGNPLRVKRSPSQLLLPSKPTPYYILGLYLIRKKEVLLLFFRDGPLECALQARIFRSPLRDQDLLVQDEKLNLVVQCLVLYQRQVHSDRNTRPQTRDNHTPPPNPQMKLQDHHPTGATFNFIKMLQLKLLSESDKTKSRQRQRSTRATGTCRLHPPLV
jgi:hypothetical protein